MISACGNDDRMQSMDMWTIILVLLFADPSNETRSGISELMAAYSDPKEFISNCGELLKKDTTTAKLLREKDTISLGYKAGFDIARSKCLECIDKRTVYGDAIYIVDVESLKNDIRNL